MSNIEKAKQYLSKCQDAIDTWKDIIKNINQNKKINPKDDSWVNIEKMSKDVLKMWNNELNYVKNYIKLPPKIQEICKHTDPTWYWKYIQVEVRK